MPASERRGCTSPVIDRRDFEWSWLCGLCVLVEFFVVSPAGKTGVWDLLLPVVGWRRRASHWADLAFFLAAELAAFFVGLVIVALGGAAQRLTLHK